MNLTRTHWPLGWTPNADDINGDPSGLLRMDNLYLDEQGALTLVRGLSLLYSFSDFVDRVYSRVIGGTEHIWTSAGPSGNSIARDGAEICSGSARAAFGDCLGQTLIFAGATRKKDNLGDVKDLGLSTPGTPGIGNVQQPKLTVGDFSIKKGTAGDGGGFVADKDTLQAIFTGGGGDFFNIGDGAAVDPTNDIIQFDVTCSNGSSISSIRLDCLTSQNNYFTYTWDSSAIQPGDNTFTVSAKRGDFKHFGRNAFASWSTIGSTQVTFQLTDVNATVNATKLQVIGGIGGQLRGSYQWLQIDLLNNGTYVARSPAGIPSALKEVQNGYVTLTPTVKNPNATKHQFYRYGGTLNDFYLVGTSDLGQTFDDKISDDEALEVNIFANRFLLTIKQNDDNPLPDDIIGVEGLFAERMLYMSSNFVYLSDKLNPDAVDARYTLKAFGDTSEQNLWIKKVTNNVCLLGTNKDLYEITGTWTALPDGTIDVYINKIGEKYPPLTMDCCSIPGGGVAYIAGDGIRVSNGSNSALISEGIKLLFQGESRHGVPPVVISGAAIYRVAAGKTRLYASLPSGDGGYRLFVYNLLDKTWRIQWTDPVTVYTTETDRVLLGYGWQSSDNPSGSLYVLDTGEGVGSSTGWTLNVLTVADHNGQPRNRKDTFTLKVVAHTGGRPCTVSIAKDGGGFISLGEINSSGPQTSYFPLDGVTLGFRYQIKIADRQTLLEFKLYELTIEYDPRPEQLDYLRVPNTNLGSYARKRFTAFAFVIDTLGNSINFSPWIDNSPLGINFTVNTNGKQTFICYFTSEVIGTDIGGIFSGGIFEFYSVNEEESVSEKMPVPCKYLVIPPNNYGTPNRKRHSSYKFQINTRGSDVTFLPVIDGVTYQSVIFNSGVKSTVEYFFTSDTIGIDIGGTLSGTSPFEFYGTIIPQNIEELPPRLKYYRIPNTNLGSNSRKRFITYSFVIDTRGSNVTFIPSVNEIPQQSQTVNTNGKDTVIYYFRSEVIGTDIGGTLSGSSPFEFYGLNLEQCTSEVMPAPTEYLVIPANNYGTPNRKRHSSYKFQINTEGNNVTFTPVLDGVSYAPQTYNTLVKTTVEYFFTVDTIAIDIGGILSSNTGPFEFYTVIIPQEIEQLPARLEYFKIPNSNLGSDCRKRFIAFAFVIDTRGSNVTFTPLVDNTNNSCDPPNLIVNTNAKQTVIYYFLQETVGTDIGGSFSGTLPFEYYGLNIEECISEKMPPPAEYLVIPQNDYGTPNRKRHSSYKFIINTRGGSVNFTPIIDGTKYPSATYITTAKQTVEYFFHDDTIGIDIGGILESTDAAGFIPGGIIPPGTIIFATYKIPFEFYGTVIPQKVEQLPDRLEYYRIPNSSIGTPARKRIRTLPLVIDTYGSPVIFTPIVDGIPDRNTSTFTTNGKTTVYHYFITDSFGIDYGGSLVGNLPFEFYELAGPQEVEILPVPKKYDQLGPARFDKVGKIFGFRIRLIVTGTTISVPFSFYGDISLTNPNYSNVLYQGTFPVVPNIDEIYEIQLPKSINFSVLRLILGPIDDSFHRYDVQIKVHTSGMETDAQWIPLR